MSKYPKILLWDVETGFNVATIFSLFNKIGMLPHDSILQERYMISACFKELGKRGVKKLSLLDDPKRFKADPRDDTSLIKAVHAELSGADVIIAHYGDNFDIKFFNSRAIAHGLNPLPPIIQIDTYKYAKAKFLFNSNRLDYLGKFLGVGGKIHTSDGLWLRCWEGSSKAVKEMVKYNAQDVELLEKVYLKLAPYLPSKLNMQHFNGGHACPLCGDESLQRRGYRFTKTGKWQRFQCTSCGSWSSAPIKVNGELGKIR